MLKATKVRIYPTPEQTEFLNRQFGAVRMVWNKALAIKTHYYKVRKQNLSPRKDLMEWSAPLPNRLQMSHD